MELKNLVKEKDKIMTVEELKTAYSVVTKIMEENRLQRDNSFNRVKNFISNKLCDILTNGETA
jgi:hypothetical protein